MSAPEVEQLAAAQPWFRAMYDTALVFAGVCRPDGILLDGNRLALEGCGFSRESEIGKPFWLTGWWAGSTRVQEQIRTWCAQVNETGKPIRAVITYYWADGTERALDFTLSPVCDESGRVAYLFPSGLDITERVIAEQEAAAAAASAAEAHARRAAAADRTAHLVALHAAEERLALTLELSEKVLGNVADGIYGLDVDGRVEFVNPAACQITGYRAEEHIGGDEHALIHARRPDGSAYPHDQCPTWLALHTRRTVVADHEVFWRRDGSPVPVELVAVPTFSEGMVTGVVVSFRDLTDRLTRERQAEQLRGLAEQQAVQRALSDRLQQALLTPPPEPDHLHVVVRYRPASHEAQVGGDWYDAFLQPDGSTMLVIGDVVGHDSSAAAAMGQLRGLLRALAYSSEESPAVTLSRVEHAARGLAVDTLATVVLARIERRPDQPGSTTRTLRWSNAGHPPPVLLSRDGTSTVLDAEPDLLLGVDPDTTRANHQVQLPDGSTMLLFTDGLIERRGAGLDEGLAQLCAALSDLGTAPLDELCDTLLARLVPHDGEDDVALLAVRTYPEDRPRPAAAGPNRLPPEVG